MSGLWDAVVVANKVDVPFRFEIAVKGSQAEGFFFEGDQKVGSSSGTYQNGVLTLEYDHLNTVLEATLQNGERGAGVLAHLGEAAREAVRQRDRQRHQLRRLVAGEADHHALVARAHQVQTVHLADVLARLERLVDALRDVRGLALDRDHHAAGLRVEARVAAVVADLGDRLADDLLDVHVGLRGDLTEDPDRARGRRGLARDPGRRVVGEHAAPRAMLAAAWFFAAFILMLNAVMLYQVILGKGLH